MAKPIKLTAALIEQMMKEFAEKLNQMKVSDGEVKYTRSITYKKDAIAKAKVLFEPVAYAKMLSLLMGYSTEVGWHGTVNRQDDNTFVITDIFVYPQTVDGVNVNTDQEEYQKWLMEFDDEKYNFLRMQGHSHVNMAVHPSKTDTDCWESILKQIDDGDYYIFMIWNKRLEHTIKIYDLKLNILYEDADIEVGIAGDDTDLNAFMEEAAEMVEVAKPSYGNYKGGSVAGFQSPMTTTNTKSKKGKGKGKVETPNTFLTDEDDDDDDIPVYSGGRYGYTGYYGHDFDEEIFGARDYFK